MFDAHVKEAVKATQIQLLRDTGEFYSLQACATIFRVAALMWSNSR